MRTLIALILLWHIPVQTLADGEPAGEFDYYVLALSWSANWCEREGDEKGAKQCMRGKNYGWVVHGLWPQYEEGYPEYCETDKPGPTNLEIMKMTGIMPDVDLIKHQWKKHGTCSGYMGLEYFVLTQEAWKRVNRPEVLRKIKAPMKVPASVVEDAFLEVNPKLTRDAITITCRDGMIQEARICLTRGLEPRTCGEDVIKDCTMKDALLMPIR